MVRVMPTRTCTAVLIALLAYGVSAGALPAGNPRGAPPRVVVDRTEIIGDADTVLWARVLAVLPARPARLEVLDTDTLSADTRRRLRGLDGFVLQGLKAIVIVRQGNTLQRASRGHAFDRLVLASLIWHEMAHLDGLDERAALGREEALWRRFVADGLVEADIGLAFVGRLAEVQAEAAKAGRAEESALARSR
jgi:hypothetical protein